ncbi:MAG: hypothetical protein LBQ70_05765 [Prevotellaceae bacterium]|jgi:hypothetical protein|nr:hypothetical protein [Prevotellaceae bacterium]
MIEKEYITETLSYLGETITDFLDGKKSSPAIERAIVRSCAENYWFTEQNVKEALAAVADKMLDGKKLNDLISHYSFNRCDPLRAGLIMAGNIPLVGFHDFLCVLLSGNIAVIKSSSKDRYLIKALCGILSDKFPLLTERILFTDAKPQNIDAVIAAGSNNSARYFRMEYRDIPQLIRKNRYSLAVLDGNETPSELEALGHDMFDYFGLGCRNVSNIFVPQNYEWNLFFEAIKKHSYVLNHQGYSDCFRYRKAIAELAGENYLTNGFVIIRKDSLAFSAIAAINCAEYEDIERVKDFLSEQKDSIQCVVSKVGGIENAIPFGYTQQPELTDYADGIDTMEFLVSVSARKRNL